MACPQPTVNPSFDKLRAGLPCHPPNISADGMAKDEEKAKRLAEALRENLRRRKAQARDAQPKKDPTQAASE